MKKKAFIKRCCAVMASAVILFTGTSVSTLAGSDILTSGTETSGYTIAAGNEASKGTIASGTCGTNVRWTLYDDGLLDITGSGAMTNYDIEGTPWNSRKSRIKKVTIRSGVTTVGQAAFYECTNLTSVTLPGSLTSIEGYAFMNCKSLKSIQFPSGLKKLGAGSFFGCSGLTSVNIPSSVKTIDMFAFQECTGLKSVILPSGLTGTDRGIFAGCTSLTGINLPVTMESVTSEVFNGCTGLTSIVLPPKTSFIGHYTFMNCSNLRSITIPKATKTILAFAFDNCTSLRDVYYEGTKSQWEAIELNAAQNARLKNATIHYNAQVLQYTKPVVSSVTPTTKGMKVTWKKISSAAKYRLFYRQVGSSTWKKVADTTAVSREVTGLTSGKQYQFAVRCVNSAGSAYTSLMSASKSSTYIAAPSIRTLTNTTTGVKVTWGKTSGAAKYRVFYKEANASSWKKAGDTTGNSYTVKGLASGKHYVFTVRCVNSAGTSYTSAYKPSWNKWYVKSPVISRLSSTSTGVKVEWGGVTGASKYRVLYRLAGSTSWKTAGSTSAKNFVVKGLTSGKTYDFTVACLNSAGTSLTSAYDTTGKRLRYQK